VAPLGGGGADAAGHGAEGGKSGGKAATAARKRRKQSMGNRRVSFAVDYGIEPSVREFASDDEQDPEHAAFQEPAHVPLAQPQQPQVPAGSSYGLSIGPGLPKPLANAATCPPPAPAARFSPIAKAPGSAAAAADAVAAAFAGESPAFAMPLGNAFGAVAQTPTSERSHASFAVSVTPPNLKLQPLNLKP